MRAEYSSGSAGEIATLLERTKQQQTAGHAQMQSENPNQKRGRGRPKGSTSSTLAEVRNQAAEDKRKLKDEMSNRLNQLREQLDTNEARYKEEIRELQDALKASEQREAFFRTALEDRLQIVADHIHKSLVDWADAELEEGQITRRKRGRPRKTFK